MCANSGKKLTEINDNQLSGSAAARGAGKVGNPGRLRNEVGREGRRRGRHRARGKNGKERKG